MSNILLLDILDTQNSKMNKNIAKNKSKETKQTENKYIFYDRMDDNNKKAMDVWQDKGQEDVVKYMINPTGKKRLTYAEIRMMFG